MYPQLVEYVIIVRSEDFPFYRRVLHEWPELGAFTSSSGGREMRVFGSGLT